MPKYNYNDIKKEIKESKKLIYWLNDKGDIILIGDDKNITKDKIMKDRKVSGLLYRFVLTFHTGKKPGQGGPLAINIRPYIKECGSLSNGPSNKSGIIWFDQDYLERRGWRENFITLTYSIITRKSFEFKIRIYVFDQLL